MSWTFPGRTCPIGTRLTFDESGSLRGGQSATGPARHTRRGDATSGSRPGLPPDCRPPIGSDPSAHAGATGGRRGPRRTPDGCRRAGDAAAMLTLGHVTHHVLALVPLTPLHQGAVAEGVPTAARSPLPPSPITRSPWDRGPARPRTGGTGSTPARSRCPSRQSPGTVCPPSS